MPQMILPIFERDMTFITPELGYAKREGSVYYFHGGLPVFSHSERDLESFRMFTSQLIFNNQCSQSDIREAFGISAISVKRNIKKYREGGPKIFYMRSRVRRSRVLTEEVLQKAQSRLNEGKECAEVAKELDLKVDTLTKAIRKGKLVNIKKKR